MKTGNVNKAEYVRHTNVVTETCMAEISECMSAQVAETWKINSSNFSPGL
jgi:hypothetical protein